MIGFYLTIALGRLISILPFSLLYLFSDFVCFLLTYLIRFKRKVILHNLRISFPEKDEKWRKKILKKFYKNFADILVESLKSLTISEKEIRERFILKNPGVFQRLYDKNKGLIMVMGHYTNFEWTAMSIPLLVPNPCFAVYHKLKNKRFSQQVVKIREQFGLKLFSMKETYPFMLNNSAQAPLYVFMADQSPHKGKIKYRAPFMGIETPVHLGVENLAKKCDLAVVFIDIQRVKRGYYEVEAKLLYENTANVPQYEITNTHVKELEKVIQKKPEDWLWSHRRWKNAKY